MSEPVVPAPSAEEVEALRAELDALKAENARLSGTKSPERKARTRTNWAIVLVVIGALIFAIAPTAIWLRSIVFDTDRWVETVAPLAEDPAIQAAVSTAASDAIIEQLDAEKRIADLLPDEYGLDRFAPALASSVENAIRTQADKLVESEQFATLWAEINRKGHQALITSITGREGIVSIESGTFTLDTGLLIDEVKTRLVDRGLGFVANIPTSSLDKEVVLYQSDALAAMGPILDAIQAAAFFIPLIAIIFIAGAFVLAGSRQRVAFWFGIAVTIFGVLPLQMLYLSQYAVANRLEKLALVPADAAQNAFTIIFRDLMTADKTLTFFGILIVVGAVLAGPSRWAVALRSGMSGGLASASSHLELGRFGAWVAAHKGGLRAAGFILAAVILVALPAPRTIGTIIWLAVLVVIWLLAVEFFGAASGEPEAAGAVEVTGESPDDTLAESSESVTEAQIADTSPGDEPEEPEEAPEDAGQV